jgi:hypothetical protein
MYYRFEGPGGWGIFMSAAPSKLFGQDVLPDRVARAERLHAWLWSCTPPADGRAYRTPTPGTRATTWFVAEAREHVRAAWELAELLSAVGVPIRLIRSAKPGTIVFRDDVQVVVWSGKDLPRGISVPRYRAHRREGMRDRTTIRRWKEPLNTAVSAETWAKLTPALNEGAHAHSL